MDQKHFHIKNMVCSHCAEVLEEKLIDAGFEVQKIELGELLLAEPVDEVDYSRLVSVIRDNGFDLIDDENSRIVEKIKHYIIQQVRSGQPLEMNLSEYLAENIQKDYQQLSRLFSAVEGKSIERYFILQKIERAKELIVYDEKTLSEIALELDYSSQQHFSRQFKKETGLSPSHFKEVKENKRTSIDQL
ncbi:helix-turn-helix domain-containing protein [Aliifodinibius sp. S!AR15-10]|uniref:helix-turn-helix domain-containing protein n=1 Tax=Aliifodinibius sp. S!AR15-10 TaxID=2950437 RepID=UPI002863E946|nr:helix-turn-helix domain-containing protein [Aliifodinibius sp. S!AR15-10]MDR8391983.1 helix-turn-helix domain-containing protein [Aliifodinibius sp. S!AR15-10]